MKSIFRLIFLQLPSFDDRSHEKEKDDAADDDPAEMT